MSKIVAVLLIFLSLSIVANAAKSPIADSKQMILVTTADWSAVGGKLRRFERSKANGKWRKVGENVQIVVGRTGLAWGAGLHDKPMITDEKLLKREGDGKSPAGAFALESIFGAADASQTKFKMPYLQLIESTECVDDVKSGKYNTIVDRYKVGNFDWKSSEKMLEVGEQYVWGITVAHNSKPIEKSKGSCIFLHVWQNAETGTSGCTAMEKPQLEAVLNWLDAKENPVLVQLPTAEFDKNRKSWKLPKLK